MKSYTIATQKDYPAPPVAALIPDTLKEFGHIRIDNYAWLKNRSNPDVVAYLKAENAYCDTVMAHTAALREMLFQEMKAMIKEEDQTVPILNNGYFYYERTEKDKQYTIYCRKKEDATEEILFDVNKMAEGSQAYLFAGYEVSNDNKLAAYSYNTTGSYAQFNLKVRDLASGKDMPFEIENIQSFVWANDNAVLFYTLSDRALRANRVYRHTIGSNKPDKLIYEEKDDLFDVYLSKSKTREFIYIISESFNATEFRYLPADKPYAEFKILWPLHKDVEYYAEHARSKIYIKYKDPKNLNSKIYEAPSDNFQDTSAWKELVRHDTAVKIQDMEVFDNYLALYIRKNGLDGIEVVDLATGEKKSVPFPEPVYVISPIHTPEYSAVTYRFSYSSLNRPNTVFDYNMVKGTREKLKEQEIPGGFNAENYTVERLVATATDGMRIPIAMVYKKSLRKDGSNPTLILGYGSYGINTDANFRASVFSLVDRGFIFAITQIRGGSEMGERWYEDGRLMKKKNTFTDFIACTEYLIREKYTNPAKIGIMGGSAGGLLVGAVMNMRPDLFNVVLAAVPFVDVLNTLQDKNLPLTTQEYEQWGDPENENTYRYILSYSPYDNVAARNYPNIMATAGWNDSQVSFHEPAKWVAKIRALKTDDNLVLIKTNLESGHGGATGRFDYLRDMAYRYAFLIDRMGVDWKK